jgi:hypothetical protein
MGNSCFKRKNRDIIPATFPIVTPCHNLNWKRGKLIGQGACAKVYECLNIDTG